MDFVVEGMARKRAMTSLRVAQRHVATALSVCYDGAPGYAGEVESVKAAIEQAIASLNGEPVE